MSVDSKASETGAQESGAAPPGVDSRDAARRFLEIVPLVMRVVAADLRGSDRAIEPAYFRLLGMLYRRERTLGELAEIQAVSLPTMSNTVSTLESRGWVTRSRSDADRRVVVVRLTAAGREVLAEVHGRMLEKIAGALDLLSSEDRRRLDSGLEILGRVFRDDSPKRGEAA